MIQIGMARFGAPLIMFSYYISGTL